MGSLIDGPQRTTSSVAQKRVSSGTMKDPIELDLDKTSYSLTEPLDPRSIGHDTGLKSQASIPTAFRIAEVTRLSLDNKHIEGRSAQISDCGS